jgi:flagellar hook assembly protein FlgD
MHIANITTDIRQESDMKAKVVLSTILLVLAVAGSLFAGGRPEQDTNIILTQPPQYISPGNAETGKDVLQIENIQLDIGGNATIESYELRIFNKSGQEIYRVSEEQLDERNIIAQTLGVGERPSVQVPSSISWDGTDNDGNTVPDGEYFYQLYVRDNFNQRGYTSPLSVVVDTVEPEIVEIGSDILIFSPNGDGKRDIINFEVQTGPAESWTLEILNSAGTAVFSEARTADGDTAASDVLSPRTLSWDGNNASGSLQAEGDYSFRVTGVDRAGNRAEQTLDFVLSNQAANIEMTVSGDNNYFSRYERESMDFLVSVNETSGLVSWKMEIENEEGIVYRRFAGDDSDLPQSIVFDGRGNPGRPESASVYLEDGDYTAVFSATYANGNLSRSESVPVIMDSLAPEARLVADSAPEGRELGNPLYFGGEAKPYMTFNAEYEEGIDWDLVLIDESESETVMPLDDILAMGVSFPFTWDGSDPATGESLPDGSYQLFLRATDEAGNTGISNVARFIKDTQSRAATSIELSGTVVAPGGDAGLEVVRITPVVPVTEGVEYFILTVVNEEDGRPYFSRQVRQVLDYVEWAGVRNNDTPVPDGSYRVELNIMYLNGDNPFAVSEQSILVGRSRPEVTVDVDRRLFTPNGDGDRDSIAISQSSSEQDLWTGTFTNADDEVVRTITWDGSVEDFIWDGKDDAGEVLPDGFYTYTVSSQNEYGNIGSAALVNLRIDNLSATISIVADQEVFSPNGDDYRDFVTLLPSVAIPENLRAWEIRLEREDGLIRKTFQGGSNLPEQVIWEGENDARTVEDGEYRVTFFVEYKNGNYTQREADETVILVTNPPQGFVNIDDVLFSPDGDGVNDSLTIGLDARAADRPITGWNVEILDPFGNSFRSWGGDGLPPENLTWDGLSDSGELVQSAADYTVVFTLEDNLRNTGIATAIVPIDILVIAEGDQLRINVPSIYFAGYTSDLFGVSREEQQRNFETLRRLASILNKYGEYSIAIEGHAVQLLSGAAAVREQNEVLVPLSLRRAVEVRQALAILGVDWERMSTRGIGGADPVVPHSDLDNRWKNRRVEFILER